MIFPGQGSQSIGMLNQLNDQFPIVQHVFNRASTALNFDLWDMIQQGPETELNKTWNTQPALLAASFSIYQCWLQKNETNPSFFAGHSLGEYSALTCAGVIDFEHAIKLVALRGKFMQDAVPAGVGAMYAIIGLDNDAIIQACKQAEQGSVVSAVNFNSPGQVVIAGEKDAVERAANLCKEAGAKRALPLTVSVPSHCALMQPAADKMRIELDKLTFNQPQIPVVNNVNVSIENTPYMIKKALIEQLYSPVRWTESVEFMANQGVSLFIEAGPGKVLTGLNKRINSSVEAISINDTDSLESALNLLTSE